jgi:hypothetical protein
MNRQEVKMKKHKRINKYLLIVVILLVALTGCQQQVKMTQKIIDQDSPLLKILVQSSDFSSGWKWEEIDTKQENMLAATQNYSFTETASRVFTGMYGSEKRSGYIVHTLKLYSQHSPDLSNIKFELGPLENARQFQPRLVPVGVAMRSECWGEVDKLPQASGVTCSVIVQYEHIISYVVIVAPGTMDRSILENVLNQLLTKVDEKIHQSDNTH